jgi:hypothetical protein
MQPAFRFEQGPERLVPAKDVLRSFFLKIEFESLQPRRQCAETFHAPVGGIPQQCESECAQRRESSEAAEQIAVHFRPTIGRAVHLPHT